MSFKTFASSCRFFLSNSLTILGKRLQPFTLPQNLVNNRTIANLTSVKEVNSTNRLVVQWEDNSKDDYPLVWLRDNCQCSACFDESSQSRTINFEKFNLNHKLQNYVTVLSTKLNCTKRHM